MRTAWRSGQNQQEKFKKLGIETIEDLLLYFPLYASGG